MTAQRQINLKAGLFLAASFVAVWFLWETPVVYPLKIFVVCLHELGHALAALLTGGQVVSIQIFPEEGGLTMTRGGWPFIIISAGYLGSMLLGGSLLYLSNYRQWARHLMLALAVLIGLSTVLFFRNFFAVLYGLLVAAALFFSAYRLPVNVNFYIIRFMAVACCLYALLDIRSDLFAPGMGGPGIVNDAVALSQLTGIPAIIWAVLWLAAALIVLALVLKASIRRPDRANIRHQT